MGAHMNNKLLLGMLLVSMVVGGLAFAFIPVVPVQAATNVSGIISSDTTWTQAESPYTFTGPVAINASVTLTIQAGVTINIGSWYLQVNGTLNAKGTTTNPIYINSNTNAVSNVGSAITFSSLSTNWNGQTETGCIIENAVLTSIPIIIENASPQINNNKITFNSSNIYPHPTISVDGGSPTISNNIITVTGSDFQGTGISVANSGSPKISGNTIIGVNCFVGDGIWSSGNAAIFGNYISGWACGIKSTNDVIGENIVHSNIPVNDMVTGCGISVGPNSVVQNNTIIYNPEGIVINYPSSIIAHNNLFYNQYNVATTSAANVNATYNWWGTIDTQAINQTIYDFNDNFNLGTVFFVPFLDSPNTRAPTFVNASANDGGSIAPRGIVSVSYGGSQTFNVIADAGYHILNVLVNGTSVGTVNSYTAQNIQGATTISAIFAPDPSPSPTPSSSPLPSPSPTPSSTPIVTSTPDSTPSIPEFPLLIILPLLIIVATAAGLLFKFKKASVSPNIFKGSRRTLEINHVVKRKE